MIVLTSCSTVFDRGFVFANGEWFTPSACVWDYSDAALGQPGLRQYYEQLESFFLDKLDVPKVTATYLVQELVSLADVRDPDVDSLKATLLKLGSKIASHETANTHEFQRELQNFLNEDYGYLPVLDKEGISVVRSKGDNFYINDHSHYAQKFTGQVDMLDFDFEECSKLHGLFEKVGLTDKYLGTVVVPSSEPIESSEASQMTEDLRKRAYALSW